MQPLESVRTRLNQAVMERVAGADAREAHVRIFDTPGPRWFEPESAICRVHSDHALYVGGIRALLLQSLHPLAMAAVADHSEYRKDSWARLARTSTFLAETTFGTVETAERAIAAVRAVHTRISGRARDGRPYRADDPHLLSWVHVAEIDSFLRAHQAYGTRRLTPTEADEYVVQTGSVARRIGAVDVPNNRHELEAQLQSYRGELEGTPEAQEGAKFLLLEPPVPLAGRLPYGLLAAAAVGLLPAWAKVPLRLPHVPIVESTLVRAGGHAAVSGFRWLSRAGS